MGERKARANTLAVVYMGKDSRGSWEHAKHKRGLGQMISSEGEMDAHFLSFATLFTHSLFSVVVSMALLLSDKTLCWNLVSKLKCSGHSWVCETQPSG